MNAAPAIVLAELAVGFVDAMELAAKSVDSGAAAAVLNSAVRFGRLLP
jgi:anthranilate phosphoribosyltransferase